MLYRVIKSNLSLLVLGLAFFSVYARPGFCDYYYHPYSRPRSAPIVSLTLDPQEGLNCDLRIAAREGRVDRLLRLIALGANVNGVSDKDQSALMYAAEVCNIPVAKTLLSNGAKLSLRDKNGRTALMFAAMGSCSPVISLMTVFTGASIHAIDHSGRTALNYANDAASLYEEGAPIMSVRLIKKALWSSENLHKKTTHLSHLRSPGLIEASPKAFPLVKHS